jgi:hypothetical protein
LIDPSPPGQRPVTGALGFTSQEIAMSTALLRIDGPGSSDASSSKNPAIELASASPPKADTMHSSERSVPATTGSNSITDIRAYSGISIVSGLRLNPAWPHQAPSECQGLCDLASSLTVELQLAGAEVARLSNLWRSLQAIGADEIGDWALTRRGTVTGAQGSVVPALLAVGATVYADGEVYLTVQLDGVETALWLTEVIDLSLLN